MIDLDRHKANRRYWDRLSEDWKALRDGDGLWRNCLDHPELAFQGVALNLIRAFCGDLHGQRAIVIGSGDNYAAFALAGLGAEVTSTDISQRQLDVARQRALELGLEIEFIRADAAGLDRILGDSFDLAFSSNGFFVWISEPSRVFASVQRVLKPGGHYIFYDIHPFQRPWADETGSLVMAQPYGVVGPQPDPQDGTYQFTWTLADLLNPLCASRLVLRRLVESPASSARFWQDYAYEPSIDDSLNDWRKNPRAGLPVWLNVCAQKPGPK